MSYDVYLKADVELFPKGKLPELFTKAESESVSDTSDVFTYYTFLAELDSTGIAVPVDDYFTTEFRTAIVQNVGENDVIIDFKSTGETACDILIPKGGMCKLNDLDPSYGFTVKTRTGASKALVALFGEQT